MAARHLDWDGCFNARDLGGLRADAGNATIVGALARSDSLDEVTPAGWRAIVEHGVRTIIDLRNDDERPEHAAPRPAELTTLCLPLDNVEDRAFWDYWSNGPRFGTPLYYGPHLKRFPRRSAGVIAAIARATPGGVLIHCGVGRDRTGLVSALALFLVGVLPDDIVADYAESRARLPRLFAHRGKPDQGIVLDAFFSQEQTSAEDVLKETLEAFDVATWMREGELGSEDLARLRTRLVASDHARK